MAGIDELNCIPDYDTRDWDSQDYQTGGGGGFSFAKFIFERLPVYFKINDTYKNRNGEGLLERYLSNFGYELDFEVMPQINCYLNIIDATVAPASFLKHIADVLGNPPDVFNSEQIYRNLLAYIVSINKIKGTRKSYELFFSILGFDIEIEEIEPVDLENFYDNGGQYDSGIIYDINKCEPCSYYDITFYPKNLQDIELTPDTLRRLKVAIQYNEPINAKLRKLTFGIKVEDSIPINIVEQETHKEEQVLRYDYNNLYDDGEQYDDPDNTPLEIIETDVGIIVDETGFETYQIKLRLFNNYSPAIIDINNTLLNLVAYNNNGNPVYQDVGSIHNVVNIPPNIVEAEIIKPYHNIGGMVTLQLKGLIYLDSGKVANIDQNINPETGTFFKIYFK